VTRFSSCLYPHRVKEPPELSKSVERSTKSVHSSPAQVRVPTLQVSCVSALLDVLYTCHVIRAQMWKFNGVRCQAHASTNTIHWHASARADIGPSPKARPYCTCTGASSEVGQVTVDPALSAIQAKPLALRESIKKGPHADFSVLSNRASQLSVGEREREFARDSSTHKYGL